MTDAIVIGCDIGTGSCKAIAMNTSGQIVAETQVYYSILHPHPRYSEQDPETIWKAFIKCLADLCKNLKTPPVAVSLSTCMHSLLLMDKNGKPLTNLITWEDSRSHKISSCLRKERKGKKIYKQTGTPIHSMSPLCKIAWFQKNRKRIFHKTAFFIDIKAYLWHRIFGEYKVDHSVASATGIFNIHKFQWDKTAMEFCGIDESRLPQLVATTFLQSSASKDFLSQTGLQEAIRFCIGGSDGCMANVGSDITNKHKAAITIGTSGAVRINSPAPIADYDTMIFNYVLDKKTFICGGPANNGGNVFQWLINTFMDVKNPAPGDYDKAMKKIAEIPAGCEGLICLPFLYGERAPVWDENASAVWFGVKPVHTKWHFMRAALEGICFGLNAILEILQKSAFEIKELHASGGFIQSHAWVQLLADITGKKMTLNDSGDASSIGAARWAMKAMRIRYLPLNKKQEERILPNPNHLEVYRKNFAIYKKLYKTTKEEMHRLQ